MPTPDKVSVHKTPNNTLRLYIPKDWFPLKDHLIYNQLKILMNSPFSRNKYILDSLSVWGGHDYQNDTHYGWEFSNPLTVSSLKAILCRLFNKIQLEDFTKR